VLQSFGLVVPKAEVTLILLSGVLAGIAIFSTTRSKVSTMKTFGRLAVTEVWMKVRIDAGIGKADVGTHDLIFKGLSIVVPFLATLLDVLFLFQDGVIVVYEGAATF
jgi:hypothetical protein